MAKSMRSKIKRRFRALRRNYINQTIQLKKCNNISKKLYASIVQIPFREQTKKNSFLYPNDLNAQFPQRVPQPIIDLRSSSIPGSGLQFCGAYRKASKQKKLLQLKENQIINNLEKCMDELKVVKENKQQDQIKIQGNRKKIKKNKCKKNNRILKF